MDLKGVTQDMSTKMNRIMTDSIIQGKGPRETGRELNKVTGIGRNRGLTIARTETIRAHADGQLEALKNLGVEEVGVMVEWSSASDDLVCPLCADMDGSVMPIDKAGSIIPLHPNCRCCWLPANIGEDKSRKVWTEKDKEGKAVWRDLEQKSGKEVEDKLTKLGFDKTIGERLPSAFADRAALSIVQDVPVAEVVKAPVPEAPDVVEIMPEVKAPIEVGTPPKFIPQPPAPVAEIKSLDLELAKVKEEVADKKAALDKINAEIAEKQAQLAQVKLDIASVKKEALVAWDDKLPADKGMESVKKAFNADMQSMSTKEQVDHVGWTLTSIEDKLGDSFKVWRDAWKEGMPANDHARFQFMKMRSGRNGQYLTGTGRIEVQARYAELTSRSTEVPKFGNEAYTVDNSVSGTIRHEYGHFIHDKFVGAQEAEWESIYSSWRTSQVISQYGKTDSAEYFAEAFSALTHPNYSKAATKIPWEVEQWFVKRGIVK
jgi:SPP1 gp7 family putative phage head morphogenesis protein